MQTRHYIILDPVTGNGVYKIASGEDGLIKLMGLLVASLMYLVVSGISPQALAAAGPQLAGGVKKAKKLTEVLQNMLDVLLACGHNPGFAMIAWGILAFYYMVTGVVAGLLGWFILNVSSRCPKVLGKLICGYVLYIYVASPILDKLASFFDGNVEYMTDGCKRPINVGNGGDI